MYVIELSVASSKATMLAGSAAYPMLAPADCPEFTTHQRKFTKAVPFVWSACAWYARA